MSARPLVIGAGGHIGRALCRQLGADVLAPTIGQLDLSRSDVAAQLDAFTAGHTLSGVINAAAYTQVDKAESEEMLVYAVNATAPGIIAQWCAARQLPFIHYSTDYVYDGKGNAAYSENQPLAPLNLYGRAKAAGDAAVSQAGGQYIILRTSWLFDAQGQNFFTTMLQLMKERSTLSIVDDQIGAPTYAPHLAKATIAALAQLADGKAAGLYHVCARGQVSRYDFAKAILVLAQARDTGIKCTELTPVPTSSYPTPATRPLNSRLDCSKAQQLGLQMPSWEEGLREAIADYYAH